MTLKWRLMLIIGALVVLLLVLANVLSLRRAEHDSLREIEATTHLLLTLLPSQLGRNSTTKTLADAVRDLSLDKKLGKTRHVVVELHAPSGQMVWSSHVENSDGQVPSFISRISRLRDLPPQRKEILAGESLIGYLLVRPNPADELGEIESDYLDQALLTCIVAVLLLVAVYLTISMALQPLALVRRGLAELQAGNLGTRLPRFSLPEMTELAASFNHTAAALEDAVAQRRRLMQKLVGMEEDTRRSVARDLHDELSPYLVAMQPHALLIADACARHEQLAGYRASAQSLIDHVAHLLLIVRNLLERLRPPEIEELGLRSALQGLIDQWRDHSPRQVSINFSASGDWSVSSATIDVSIYRIVQECLTNAFKHSDADGIAVNIDFSTDSAGHPCVQLSVTDNGKSHLRGSAGGLGVLGMRERVEALGGSLTAGPIDGVGWRVQARLLTIDDIHSIEVSR